MLLIYIVCCFSHCVLFLPLCVVSPIVCCFSHCVLFLPLCVVSPIVCCFSHCVLFLPLCVVSPIVCCFSHCVLFLPLCVVSPIVCCFSHCVLFLPLCVHSANLVWLREPSSLTRLYIGIVADRKHASTYWPVAFRSVHTGIGPPFLLKIFYAITACMTQGFTSRKYRLKEKW